eukprot:sb/3479284/
MLLPSTSLGVSVSKKYMPTAILSLSPLFYLIPSLSLLSPSLALSLSIYLSIYLQQSYTTVFRTLHMFHRNPYGKRIIRRQIRNENELQYNPTPS